MEKNVCKNAESGFKNRGAFKISLHPTTTVTFIDQMTLQEFYSNTIKSFAIVRKSGTKN